MADIRHTGGEENEEQTHSQRCLKLLHGGKSMADEPATRTIMVVDDEPDIRELMKDILTSYGFDIILASSHAECMAKLKEKTPDLILLDIMMPEVDGWETLKSLKSNPHTKNIPVAMLTVVVPTYRDFIEKDIYSLVHYIIKPFTTENLMEKVRGIFQFQEMVNTSGSAISDKLAADISTEYTKLLKMVSIHEKLMNLVKSFYAGREQFLREKTEQLFKLQQKTIESYKKRLDNIRTDVEEVDT
jgi:CheY-like chemotaxis protein